MLKTNKITVLLDQPEFDRFEEYCQAQGFKKSTLIARLIRTFLDSQDFTIQRALPLGRNESSVGSRRRTQNA